MRRYPVLRVSRAPRIVSGCAETLDSPPERVALIASWMAEDTASKSLSELVRRLRECDYTVIVTVASSHERPPRWPHGLDAGVVVMQRPNLGYDFGSWAATLHRFPAVAHSRYVLQVNDSLVGPFTSLEPLIEDFEKAAGPVWGLVDSTQHFPHLQSFFIGYQQGLLADPRFQQFWRDVRVERDKRTLIGKYELGLGRLIHDSGLRFDVMFPWQDVATANQNPSVFGWRRLLDRGFPFVKREVLKSPPPEVRDAADAPFEIERHFGQDVRTWL